MSKSIILKNRINTINSNLAYYKNLKQLGVKGLETKINALEMELKDYV